MFYSDIATSVRSRVALLRGMLVHLHNDLSMISAEADVLGEEEVDRSLVYACNKLGSTTSSLKDVLEALSEE